MRPFICLHLTPKGMTMSHPACADPLTHSDKIWPQEQYYFGDRDTENRRDGRGENHWTSAESLEWYIGDFCRDTMTGQGDYRWRYRGKPGEFLTYEGHFFVNRLHGYGVMSYPDGRVFKGLYRSDVRYGPGVQSHVHLVEDVGLWAGERLVRLCWRPPLPSVVPDLLSVPGGKNYVAQFRTLMAKEVKILGETNSALDLLKHYGVEPLLAVQKWKDLYAKTCTDMASVLCHRQAFEQAYYKGKIHSLTEIDGTMNFKEPDQNSVSSDEFSTDIVHYAWNNTKMMIDMMKHCYRHDKQRDRVQLNLKNVLSGPRTEFKTPGKHELKCRILLMSSYLNHMTYVVPMVNEENIFVNIADIQGNTALMYATSGNAVDVINFLAEAGAWVDCYNDACLTPLGVALIQLTAIQQDLNAMAVAASILPPTVLPIPDVKGRSDWHISRDLPQHQIMTTTTLPKTLSKMTRLSSSHRKIKSLMNIKKSALLKKSTIIEFEAGQHDKMTTEEHRIFATTAHEYDMRVTNQFLEDKQAMFKRYVFEVPDMVADYEQFSKEARDDKKTDKNITRHSSNKFKISKEVVWAHVNHDDELFTVNSAEKYKIDITNKVIITIKALLSLGASPRLVRCPQPALVMALYSGSTQVLDLLCQHGADVNEVYPQMYNYRPIDIVVSRQLNSESVEQAKVLLANGAVVNHRLVLENTESEPSLANSPGPNLLHILVNKKYDTEFECEIRKELLELILEYKCDPFLFYQGRSSVDLAVSKNIDLLEILARHAKSDLNKQINDNNECVLVKMFLPSVFSSLESVVRSRILTNLLAFGADPLLEVQVGEQKYQNWFVFVKKLLDDMKSQTKTATASKDKNKKAEDKSGKATSDKKNQDTGKSAAAKVDLAEEYSLAVALVADCARLLHVRWLQGNLLRELVRVVQKYKHRSWHLIIKEHKNRKQAVIWLRTHRCLEMWDLLRESGKKVYQDLVVYKQLMFIVHYYCIQDTLGPKLTFQEKEKVEAEALEEIKEHNLGSLESSRDLISPTSYVKPELLPKFEPKFNVCFECAAPLQEDKITCELCDLVTFCNMECLLKNSERPHCHPCADYLRNRYYVKSQESMLIDQV